MTSYPIFIGCAGWALRTEQAALFPEHGTHLQRYAGRFNAVEINSSFYRSHRPATYVKWAQSVPAGFQFSVKLPQSITHDRRLVDVAEPLDQFLNEVRSLGEALGPILIQLPPSLTFTAHKAEAFFQFLRDRYEGDVVLEPRHRTWFTEDVQPMLEEYHLARVAADPPVVPGADEPAGWDGLAYYRLHGSPRIYYSEYATAALDDLRTRLRAAARGRPVWCIFDNTALGWATVNALDLRERLGQEAGVASGGR